MAYDLAARLAQRQEALKGARPQSGYDVTSRLLARGITPKADLSTLEGLTTYATQRGLGREVSAITNDRQKLSFLQRLGTGLSSFNPAEAILTGTEKGAAQGALKYATGIGQGLAGAATGTNYQGERRYFADIAEKLGVENKIARFGIGFLGDVLLDPTTYFGGALARGLTAGVKGGTNLVLKGVGKVAPTTEQGLRLAGGGIKDAFGRAFIVGHKASQGAREDVLTFLSKKDRATIGLAGSNLNRLGIGVLTKNQQEQLTFALIAGKRAEFTARQAGKTVEEAGKIGKEVALKGAAPDIAEVLTKKDVGVFARTAKFGEQLGLDNPYEAYFPFIKKEKLEKFLKDVDVRKIKVGSEGYRKEFKNLLTNESLELDPAKAFFTREAAQVADRMSRDFLTGFARKYGRPLIAFKSADDAARSGYKILREKGIFGKEIGWISQHDARLLDNLVTPEFQTVNMLAKATGFDALTNLFKRSVTGLFLPFHVRNFVSGTIQNYEILGPAALNPKAIAVGQKIAYLMAKGRAAGGGTMIIKGRPEKFSRIFDSFAARFGSDTFYHNDFLQAADTAADLITAAPILSKTALKQTVKTVGLGSTGIPFRSARVVGQFIEHQQKATAYIVALGQGKTIPQALKIAEQAGFDYRSLTAFESQILRRIIPFYSFTRKNIELQLKTLGENPQRVNQIFAFFKNLGEQPSEEEKTSLPDYIRNSIGIKLEDLPNGIKQYISGFGTPVEQFAGLVNGNPVLLALSMSNPLLKAPIELGIGKDSFRQKDLKDVYDAREYSAAPRIIKDLLEIKEVTKPVLKKNAIGKLVKVGERKVYVANPERLLIARSLFTSRGFSYLDQIFDGDMQGFVKWVKLTTGIKPQQVDIELSKSLKERDQKRALEDLLIKTDGAVMYSRTYVPRGTK